MKRARINLSLENDLLEWLEQKSTDQRTSVSAVVRQLVDKAKLAEHHQTKPAPLLALPIAPPQLAHVAETFRPAAPATPPTKPTRYKLTK